MKKMLSIYILLCFALTSIIGPCPGEADEAFILPTPGVRVNLSPHFNPPILRGLKVDINNPFKFDFILDEGDHHLDSSPLAQNGLNSQATRLIKYFLASLTIPENDLWVNLSPYEKNRIIPVSFGKTEMGRDLLAEDYILKQITASLVYPEDAIGKEFWKRIYEEAQRKFGTTDIPVNTFNKVWIVPQKAVVFENAKEGTAYVIESRLKVMLEEDYLSLEKHSEVGAGSKPAQKQDGLESSPTGNDLHSCASQIIREIVIPELTKEVNEGQNFAQLRQVYNSLILAAWYKKKIKNSILDEVYADKNKVKGIGYKTMNPRLAHGTSSFGQKRGDDIEEIYRNYLQAFKQGVYNYIKEDVDPLTQQPMARKYFSGGVNFFRDLAMTTTTDSAMLPSKMVRSEDIKISILPIDGAINSKDHQTVLEAVDKAMFAKDPYIRHRIKEYIDDHFFVKGSLSEGNERRIGEDLGFWFYSYMDSDHLDGFYGLYRARDLVFNSKGQYLLVPENSYEIGKPIKENTSFHVLQFNDKSKVFIFTDEKPFYGIEPVDFALITKNVVKGIVTNEGRISTNGLIFVVGSRYKGAKWRIDDINSDWKKGLKILILKGKKYRELGTYFPLQKVFLPNEIYRQVNDRHISVKDLDYKRTFFYIPKHLGNPELILRPLQWNWKNGCIVFLNKKVIAFYIAGQDRFVNLEVAANFKGEFHFGDFEYILKVPVKNKYLEVKLFRDFDLKSGIYILDRGRTVASHDFKAKTWKGFNSVSRIPKVQKLPLSEFPITKYANQPVKDKAIIDKDLGGIDLTSSKMNVEVKNEIAPLQIRRGPAEAVALPSDHNYNIGFEKDNKFKFHLDPAMMQEFKDATGFVPVIISVRPMIDLKKFLGIDPISST